MKRRILCVLICCFGLAYVANGQDIPEMASLRPASFVPYDVDQGLLTTCVVESFQDHRGRLWVNPCRKQDMHKGESFFQFDGNKSYPVDMPDLALGARAATWFITDITQNKTFFGANLSYSHSFYFNPETRAYQLFSFAPGERIINQLNQKGDTVIVITQDQKGYAIHRLSPEKKETLGRVDLEIPNLDYSYRVPAVLSDSFICFLDQQRGFVQFDFTQETFKVFRWHDLIEGDLSSFGRSNLMSNKAGKLTFFVSAADAFFDFDPQKEQMKPNEALNPLIAAHPQREINPRTVYFYQDNSGNTLIEISVSEAENQIIQYPIYLLDAQGKICRYLTSLGDAVEAKRLQHNVNNSRPSNGGFINGEDFKKQAFICLDLGLMVLEFKEDLAIEPYALSVGSRAIIEYHPDQVIILSDKVNKGILDLNQKKLTESASILGEILCDQSILASGHQQLVHQDNNNIWFIGEDQLIHFRKDQASCQEYPIGYHFRKFTFLNPQEIALVTDSFDLFFYDLATTQTHPFSHQDRPLNIGEKANEMLVSSDGILWIASLNGLWRVDPNTGSVLQFTNKNGLADNRVICLHEDQNNRIWLGMIGGGVQIFDPQKESFTHINQNQGLSNNSVVGILEDEDGDMWLSTFSGISVLSKQGEILFKLHEKDGITHKEFNRFSYHKLEDGRFVFGSVSGVNVIDPGRVKQNLMQRAVQQLYLTEISYYDQKKEQDTLLNSQFNSETKINLPATHRYLSLNFSVSDYSQVDSYSFAYQLIDSEELNPDELPEARWLDIGNNSYLTLNNLPRGKHKLVVRATNKQGQVISNLIYVPIRVKAFFYQTWWFYLLCSLPFIAGIFLWNRRLVSEKKRLAREVEKRTQQIRMDKQLIEEQAHQLQELDEMKSRFFTNISHEFRTPLTVISGMAKQVKTNPGQWLEKGNNLIIRNSKYLLSLINQILDLRKLEAGMLKANYTQANIIPFLHYIVDSFSLLGQSNGVKLHFLSTIEELNMDFDPDKIFHILSNLLSNAIKYSPDGGDVYVQLDHFQQEKESLRIQVKDTGQGIAPEVLPYIFDRFYQVEDLANQKPQGSGVGLALSKELVQLLQGSIEVESKVQKGTCFILHFPITREATKKKWDIPSAFAQSKEELIAAYGLINPLTDEKVLNPAVQNSTSVTSPSDQKPTLLIVEDNQDIQLYLRTCLDEHYQLSFAENGQQGIDLALAEVPDLIVSDVMMPVKNGYELCDTLKNDERTSHIPIIMLTAKADFESKMEGLRSKADAYLTKPFNQEELLLRLRNLLEIRRKLQLKYSASSLQGFTQATLAKEKPTNQEDAFLQKLRQLILDHIDRPELTADFISQQMGMSYTNIYRKLKALTGHTLVHFIRQIRMKKAKELLLDSNLNIAEVAYALGFTDPNYFSRIFSDYFKQTPSDYRKN